MNKKKRSRPATYRELRQTLSRKLLPREAFDLLIEQMGAVERIASLWTVHLLRQWRGDVEKGASDPPAPEDFNRIRAGEDHIKQRLRDRLYYAAVLAVMEAEPAGLGQEVQVSHVESCEKLTAILGRKMAPVSGIDRLCPNLRLRHEHVSKMAIRAQRAIWPLAPFIAFDCARHSTRAMIRVQRSPQRKKPGDEPGFSAVRRPASSLTLRRSKSATLS